MGQRDDKQAERGYGGQREPYAAQFSELLGDLDAFWAFAFQDAGAAYRSPGVVPIVDSIRTGCGPADPSYFAFYCPIDETIYYSVPGFAIHEGRFGDFAPIVVIAHEWGHHVQWLLRMPHQADNAYELQADCLAGAYANDAAQRGLLDPGDVTEAVSSSAAAGDDPLLPQDQPGAHGINDQRISALMRGYLDGVLGCNLPIVPRIAPAPPPVSGPSPGPLPLPSLLPATLSLPQGQPFRLHDDGTRTLDDLAAGFPNPAEATRLLRAWGWQENAIRIFASDNPPPDAAGWVELSIHRFATVDAAAEALPYFAEGRLAAAGLHRIDLGLFSDQSIALVGPAYNGDEVTIYARRGNLVVRATGIAPNGDPTADVIEAMLFPLLQLVDEPRVVSPELFALLPTASHVPPGLRLAEEHARSASTLATSFANPAETEQLFQAWGWRESASRVFVADGAGTAAGSTRLEVVVFRLADSRSAAEALPYFLDARAEALRLSEVAAPRVGDESRAIAGSIEGGREATIYVRIESVLLRITAIGPGDPMADLEALLA